MTAKFEADATFLIKGRGLVLAGRILEGKVEPGMNVSILSFPKKLTIQGIERIYGEGLRPGIIGLLFPLGNDQDILLWKTLAIKGRIIEILDKEESPS